MVADNRSRTGDLFFTCDPPRLIRGKPGAACKPFDTEYPVALVDQPQFKTFPHRHSLLHCESVGSQQLTKHRAGLPNPSATPQRNWGGLCAFESNSCFVAKSPNSFFSRASSSLQIRWRRTKSSTLQTSRNLLSTTSSIFSNELMGSPSIVFMRG